MPSVVTIAVMPTRLTSTPVTTPAASAAPNAYTSANGSLPESPFGTRVMMTTVSEIIPGTDRSIPPCWTTSVCPTATMASTAANGSMPSRELWRTLCGSTSQLTRKSSAVATTIAVAAPPTGRRGRRRCGCWCVVIPFPLPQGVHEYYTAYGATVNYDRTFPSVHGRTEGNVCGRLEPFTRNSPDVKLYLTLSVSCT